MRNSSLTAFVLATGLVLLAPMAEARGRGGAAAPRSVPAAGRQGTVSTPRGTGSWQGTSTGTRQPGSLQQRYQGTRTGPQGQTSTVDRTNQVDRTGPNTWDRATKQTVTGPNGQQRSWEAQGSGAVNKTETGVQKTYQGTVTNDKGKSMDVNRTTDVTKNADGSVTKDTNATYTKENGNSLNVDRTSTTTKNEDGSRTTDRNSTFTNGTGDTLGTGQSTTVRTPGQATQTTGSYTSDEGRTWNYEGQSSRTEPGTVEHSQQVTAPNGQTHNSNSQARWQYIDGKWVRVYSVQAQPGTPNP